MDYLSATLKNNEVIQETVWLQNIGRLIDKWNLYTYHRSHSNECMRRHLIGKTIQSFFVPLSNMNTGSVSPITENLGNGLITCGHCSFSVESKADKGPVFISSD